MKCLFISDTHGLHNSYALTQKLEPADVIIHAGDISNVGTELQVRMFLLWFANLQDYKHKIFIAGNHDFYFDITPKFRVQDLMDEYPNITYLQDSSVEIDGVKFWGTPHSLPFFNWAFMGTEEKLNEYWGLIPDDTDVLITHIPPHGILDYTVRDHENAGSISLYDHITNRIKPKVNVFGHIHEGHGILVENDITYINASVLDHKYNMINKPMILTI